MPSGDAMKFYKNNKEENTLRNWCIKNYREELLSEWDYLKNNEFTPDNILYSSEYKAWWICPQKHSYSARVGNRTHLSQGCPYCSNHKVLEGYNDLKTWCIENNREDLLKEWDYSKNNIIPSQITSHSSKTVWWKCSLGHEWESVIFSRAKKIRPTGCPYCSNPPKRILVGFNDFESWCKKNNKDSLLREWNHEKNTEVMPNKITFGHGKRVWWRCSKGHDWYVSPANRVQGTGCPICSRTQTSFPEQAISYYLSKGFNVLQRYKIKGNEIDVFLEDYKIGIEYDGRFFHEKEESIFRESEKNRFFEKEGIAIIRIKESKEKNCVEGNTIFYVSKTSYLNPEFENAIEQLFELLQTITGVSFKVDVDLKRDELVIREKYSSALKEGSLAILSPEIAEEWDIEKNNGMHPSDFAANSHTKVWWRCKKGHSWQAVISSRYRGLGCPFCAGQGTIQGENDLESWCVKNAPKLLSEWNHNKNVIKPIEVARTSNRKAWWICEKGHEWEAIIANRVHGTRCPFCYSGNNVTTKNTLAEWCMINGQEQLLTEWNYKQNGALTPNDVAKGSHKKVWWICKNGHEWEAQIKSRTYNHGCPYCSGTNKKALVGQNDLASWCKNNGRQYILDEWDYEDNEGLSPDMFTFGSHKRIKWKCSKGHKWEAVIKERTKSRGNMCPICKKE